jgi:hypothetical protein
LVSLAGREGLISTDLLGSPIPIDARIALTVQHTAVATGDATHPIRTTRYEYQVLRSGKPLIEFHYHPGSKVKYCHVHVRPAGHEGQVLRKVHIPTGRVALEDVLTMLIEDFGVKAKRGASAVLAANRAKFEDAQSWTGPGRRS